MSKHQNIKKDSAFLIRKGMGKVTIFYLENKLYQNSFILTSGQAAYDLRLCLVGVWNLGLSRAKLLFHCDASILSVSYFLTTLTKKWYFFFKLSSLPPPSYLFLIIVTRTIFLNDHQYNSTGSPFSSAL